MNDENAAQIVTLALDAMKAGETEIDLSWADEQSRLDGEGLAKSYVFHFYDHSYTTTRDDDDEFGEDVEWDSSLNSLLRQWTIERIAGEFASAGFCAKPVEYENQATVKVLLDLSARPFAEHHSFEDFHQWFALDKLAVSEAA